MPLRFITSKPANVTGTESVWALFAVDREIAASMIPPEVRAERARTVFHTKECRSAGKNPRRIPTLRAEQA
jgi:hypothetical protein